MSIDIDSTSVRGTWWRHIPAGADALTRPADPADNRWQRGSVVEALYFADSPDTAWAEWYRYLAEAGLPPQQDLPRDLWRWEVSLPEVVDLSTDDALEGIGLGPPKPARVDWPEFQAVGEALFSDGWPALMAPSAARPGHGVILCVFRSAKEVPGVRPVPPPQTVEEVPPLPRGLRT